MDIFFSPQVLDDHADRFDSARDGRSGGEHGGAGDRKKQEQRKAEPEAAPLLGSDSATSSDGLSAALLCSLDPSVVAMLATQQTLIRHSQEPDAEIDAALRVCESPLAEDEHKPDGNPVSNAQHSMRASIEAISGLVAIVTAARLDQPAKHFFGCG